MFKKKSLITLVSLLAILCVTVSGSLAFLIDASGPVTNIFNPSKVTTEVIEELNGTTKQNVKIKNTGDTDAYIRAAVVVTWKNASGEIAGVKPVPGTDYEMDIPGTGWSQIGDYYYWKGIVAPEDDPETTEIQENMTGVLITSCIYKDNAPEGYFLSVEIIGSGVQAKGKNAAGKTPVELAWGEDAARAVGAIN